MHQSQSEMDKMEIDQHKPKHTECIRQHKHLYTPTQNVAQNLPLN